MNGLQFDLALTALAATEARPSEYADRYQRFTFGAMVADNPYWRPGLADTGHEIAGFNSVVEDCHMAALVEDAQREHAASNRAIAVILRTAAADVTPADVAVLQPVPAV